MRRQLNLSSFLSSPAASSHWPNPTESQRQRNQAVPVVEARLQDTGGPKDEHSDGKDNG